MGSTRTGSNPIYVDVRHAENRNSYGANHGIARYSREVVSRLTLDWVPIDGPVRAPSPVDVINPRRLRLRRTDLLYSPGFNAGLARCTQLLTLHDLTHLRVPSSRLNALRNAYYEGMVKPVIARTGHVLTNTETSATAIREWLDDDRIQIHNAGIGCSAEFTREGPATDFGRPYFLYVGNLKAHKNTRPLFEAMADLPDHLLVTVLAAPDAAAATAMAEGFGIADRLVIRSAVSDTELAALYRGSEAFVFPSLWEGFGLPVMEALMTGTKVVYSASAESVARICADTQFAVEDPDDAKQFAGRMAEAAGAPFEAPSGLGEYQWDSVARRVEAVIRQVRQS